MRLWSLHPKYLDRLGLLAVWRESLLAQKVLLQGEYKDCSECEGTGIRCTKLNFPVEKTDSNNYFYPCYKCKGTGKIETPYYNHPQLERFKQVGNWTSRVHRVGLYLLYIYDEATERSYNFNKEKIRTNDFGIRTGALGQFTLTVTTEQLEYEFKHLQHKLHERDKDKFWINHNLHYSKLNPFDLKIPIKSHPLFKVIEGNIESWEKVK